MLMFWFTSTCNPPSPPACTLPCKHWGHLIFRPTKINNNSNNNRTKTTQITKTRRLNLGSWMSMSIQISFSSISFIRVSQDTVGTIFGTGLHICIMMRWIGSIFEIRPFKPEYIKYIKHTILKRIPINYDWRSFSNLAETLHGHVSALLSWRFDHPGRSLLVNICFDSVCLNYHLDLQFGFSLGRGWGTTSQVSSSLDVSTMEQVCRGTDLHSCLEIIEN